MKKRLKYSYVNFEGLCQLIWFGRISSVPTPKSNIFIRAYFVEVQEFSNNKKAFKRSSEVFYRDIPIGEVLLLPIGTVFKNNFVVTESWSNNAFGVKEGVLELDLRDENLKIIDRWAKIQTQEQKEAPLLPSRRMGIQEDLEYEGNLLCVQSGGDSYAIMIPCYEVFRFFYAVSTHMTNVLLDSRFLEYYRYVWNPARSAINLETKQALVWLRQWMIDPDAKFIAAHFAFDANAIERGMNIYRSLAADNSRMLSAVPPMSDRIKARARWIEITNANGTKSKIILELLSTDWQPLFNHLRFERDNDGRRFPKDGPKQPMNRPNDKPNVDPNDHLNKEDDFYDADELTINPPDNNTEEEQIQFDEINERFQWLVTADIEKAPQIQTEYEATDARHIAIVEKEWTNKISTLGGTKSDVFVRKVCLTSQDSQLIQDGQGVDEDELIDDGEIAHLMPGNNMLRVARGLVKIKAQNAARVDFLYLWGKPVRIMNEQFTLYCLPSRLQGDEYRWLNMPDKSVPRLGLAARITQKTEEKTLTRYFLDFQANPNNTFIVIVWVERPSDDEYAGELSIDELRRIVRDFAQEGTTKLGLTKLQGLRMGHRRHTIPQAELNNGQLFLQRIFDTSEIVSY